MKKFVLAPVLAALAMFTWGFLFWGAPPFLPYQALQTVADESATALAIGKLLPASGAYLIPSPLSGQEKMVELARRGPSVEVHIRQESLPAMDPTAMLIGFLHNLVLAGLLTALLCGLKKSLETYACRVIFCAGVGGVVAIAMLAESIWWHHSWAWTLATAFYNVTLFAIAGLVVAKFLTPRPETEVPV